MCGEDSGKIHRSFKEYAGKIQGASGGKLGIMPRRFRGHAEKI
jgi:hypothetical protein